MIKYFLILSAAMMMTSTAAAGTAGHLRSPSAHEISLESEGRPYHVEGKKLSASGQFFIKRSHNTFQRCC